MTITLHSATVPVFTRMLGNLAGWLDKAEAYLKHFATPNFYFHVTTAYALLRHNGVELGKGDFLGAPKS